MQIINEAEAVLFDLDGTLLPVDFNELVNKYFGLLSQEFSDLAEQDKFVKALLAATEKMIANDGSKTNRQTFFDYFTTELKLKDTAKDDFLARADQFYRTKFPILGQMVTETNQAQAVVEKLGRTHKLILATNPLFPRQAVVERLKWANLTPESFALITSYENMHYAKPNPKYYAEILKKESLVAKDTIMVGNDMQEDMVAKKLGCKTILIEDFLLDRVDATDYEVDWQGSFTQFATEILDS